MSPLLRRLWDTKFIASRTFVVQSPEGVASNPDSVLFKRIFIRFFIKSPASVQPRVSYREPQGRRAARLKQKLPLTWYHTVPLPVEWLCEKGPSTN